MTVIATALQHLIAAGVTGDALVTAIAEIEAALCDEQTAPKPRSAAALRSARYRARKLAETSQSVTRDVTRHACDEAPSLPPSPLASPQTPQQTPRPPTRPERKTRRARARARTAHRLPADWQPLPPGGDVAEAVAAWPPGAIERELARFRDWAASASGRSALKRDWQAAWRNWLRTADETGRHRNGRRQHPNALAGLPQGLRGSRPDPALDMYLQAQRELQAETEREDTVVDFPARAALPAR